MQIEEPFAVLPLNFQHEWLKRDVEKSRRLLQWSSDRLRAMGAAPSAAPSSSYRSVNRRAGVVVPSAAEPAARAAPEPPQERTAQQQFSELLELKMAGLLTQG